MYFLLHSLLQNLADWKIVRNFAGVMIEMKAYHGTIRDNAKGILSDGFAYSIGNEHWLGDGVYFFVEGVGYAPDRAAELWAEYRAFKLHTQFCALLSSVISVVENAFLDLTSYEGIRILNYIQLRCAQKLAAIGKGVGYVDGFLINFARTEMGLIIDAVKGNEYIQLEVVDRLYNIRRRISNCTICSVYNKEVIRNISITKEWRV